MERVVGGLYFDEPKSAASKRRIKLPAFVVAALSAQRARQDAERARLGELWEDHDLIFPAPGGAPLSTKTLDSRWRTAQRKMIKAGLPPIHFHDLRHLHATIGMARGVNAKTMSERLGHSNVSVTLRFYAHVLPPMESSAAATFDDVFAPPAESANTTPDESPADRPDSRETA